MKQALRPAVIAVGLLSLLAAVTVTLAVAATLGGITSAQIAVPKRGPETATLGAPYGSNVTTLTQSDNLSGGGTTPLNGTLLSSPINVVWDASASMNQSGGFVTASAGSGGNGVGMVAWIPSSQRVTVSFASLRSSPTTTNNGCGVVLNATGSPAAGTAQGNAIIVDRLVGVNQAQLNYGTFSGTTFTSLATSSTFTVSNTGSVAVTYSTTGQYTVTSTIATPSLGTWTIGVPADIFGGEAGFACFGDSVTQLNTYATTSL